MSTQAASNRAPYVGARATVLARSAPGPKLRVLFFVEGFTDIRFVIGLAETFDLSMVVPQRQYAESGLKTRVAESGRTIDVVEIPGGRLQFQLRSLAHLWRRARDFDLVLAQEALRGALNANLVGVLRGVPVITYVGTSSVEYFHCRRERGQIGWARAAVGETIIRTLLTINGRLAARSLAVGPYLRGVMGRYSPRVEIARHCGVDTDLFRPANANERADLRRHLDLPADKFLVFFSSRISHEKDPETVLKAVSLARSKGLDAAILNLGGGYHEFRELARELRLPETDKWVIARPAVHPMTQLSDYYRAADVVVQASLAEGAGFSPLEALSCGTPVVATAVGGLSMILNTYARLTPRRDAEAMTTEILWVAHNTQAARAQALRGREHVIREWSRDRAFAELSNVLNSVSAETKRRGIGL